MLVLYLYAWTSGGLFYWRVLRVAHKVKISLSCTFYCHNFIRGLRKKKKGGSMNGLNTKEKKLSSERLSSDTVHSK